MITFVGCSRGNVRSVTLAAVLKDLYGMSGVVTFGVDTVGKYGFEVMADMVCQVVVVGDRDLYNRANAWVPPNARIHFLEIGPDVWLMPGHPQLVKRILDVFHSIPVFDDLQPVNYPSAAAYLEAHTAAWERAHNGIS